MLKKYKFSGIKIWALNGAVCFNIRNEGRAIDWSMIVQEINIIYGSYYNNIDTDRYFIKKKDGLFYYNTKDKVLKQVEKHLHDVQFKNKMNRLIDV